MFVSVTVEGDLFPAITGGDFDLRKDELQMILLIGKDADSGSTIFFTSYFRCIKQNVSTVRRDCLMMLVLHNHFEFLSATAS